MSEATIVGEYGDFLMEILVKGSVLLAFGLIIVILLKRSSAATRHAILCSMFASTLVVVALSLVVPSWSWARESSLQSSEAIDVRQPAEATTVDEPTIEPLTAKWQEVAPLIFSSQSKSGPPSWRQPLMAIWGIGVLYFVARILAGFYLLAGLRKEAKQTTDERLLESLASCRKALGVRRAVPIRLTEKAVGPLTCGLWEPTIILPDEAVEWSEEKLRAVLLHELAHIHRGDLLATFLGQLVCALYWINPLAWVAAKRMATERELACDDMVLQQGFDAPSYASFLVEVAGNIRRAARPFQPSLSMARKADLEDRVSFLLREKVNRRGISWVRAGFIGALALAVCWPLAGFGLEGDGEVVSENGVVKRLKQRSRGEDFDFGIDAGAAGPIAKKAQLELTFETPEGGMGRVLVNGPHVLRLLPDGDEVLWHTELKEPVSNAPVVLEGEYLKFGPDKEGFCLDLKTGKQYYPLDENHVAHVSTKARATEEALAFGFLGADEEDPDEGGLGEFGLGDAGEEGLIEFGLADASGEGLVEFEIKPGVLAEGQFLDIDEDGDVDILIDRSESFGESRKAAGIRVTLSEIEGVSVGNDATIQATVVKDRFEDVTLVISETCPYVRVAELIKELEAAGIPEIRVEVRKEKAAKERRVY